MSSAIVARCGSSSDSSAPDWPCLPNVNGEQFCRFIKSNALFVGLKVLLCSGENEAELKRICRDAGADGYVQKDADDSKHI